MVNSQLDKAAHCDFMFAAAIIRKPNAVLVPSTVFSEEMHWPGRTGPKA